MLQLGLRLHDAEKLPLEELLPVVRQKGYTVVSKRFTGAGRDNGVFPFLVSI